MPAGSIVVELLAKTGSFDTDINRSTKAAEKRMKEMQRTVETVGTAVGVAMTAAGVAALAFAKHTVNGLDALNDVADATGASIEMISALEDTALRTGNSFESVSTALVKFNQQLKDTDPENKTAQILKSIGLDADRLRQIDPAEALHQVAKALAQYADDGDKARVVQELFGKSIREVAPLLKDLAEQEQLHATVTTAEAKAAEDFNKQLADMHKNTTDLARSIASDLLPQVNALLKAYREGGVLGFLGVGGDAANDPGKALAKINDELGNMRRLRKELDPANSMANSLNEFIFGDAADLDRQIKALEAQQKYLKSLQQSQALMGGSDFPDALSRRLGDRPSIGPTPLRAKAGPKGKDPDADFKAYLNDLEKQIQKVDELTVSEKLLDDIRRGSLTVTADQKDKLSGLATQIDKTRAAHKDWDEQMKIGRENVIAQVDAMNKYNDTLQELLDSGPAAQLEKQRKEMALLTAEFQKFIDTGGEAGITEAQYLDAVTGRLKLTAEAAGNAKSMTEELGMTFASAFENAVIGGENLSDVFKGLLQDIARVILRLGVIEPMMEELRSGVKSGGGFNFGSVLSSIGSSLFGGGPGVTPGNPDFMGPLLPRAAGGPVSSGSAYLIGERGPELFVPRTAGMVVPNGAFGGGGGDVTVINQTTGRVDSAHQQALPDGGRALILQEFVGQLANPNSPASQAIQRNFKLRPAR